MIVFLYILALMLIILLLIVMSKVEIKIDNMEIKDYENLKNIIEILTENNVKAEKVNILNFITMDIKVKLLLLGKLPIACIKIDSKKLKEKIIKRNKKESKKSSFEQQKDKEKLNKVSKWLVSNVSITKVNIRAELGTEDAAFTAIATTILNILISILLPYFVDPKEDIKYNVKPVFINKNLFFIQLNTKAYIQPIKLLKN